MKCECCGINEAVVKDYREKNSSKVFVCIECLYRSDHSFWCKMAHTNKRKLKKGV